MHRFYQPILPSSNLFLQHKWDFIDYEIHRQKVKHIRSEIDQRAPRTYPHMYIKPKRLQLEMESFCTIQRQNKFLLEKLEKIHRHGGWVDSDNTQHKPRSINTLARQKEATRICNENRTLLSRIKDEHTSYNRSKQEGSFAMQQKYRANIDKFPREWREMSQDMKRFRADIREKYVYPKFGKSKPKKKKFEQIAQPEPPVIKPILSDVKVEESEVTIHAPSETELKEEPKLQMTILERIKNIFARKRDKTQVKILEEDREEMDDSESEYEINQDKENDEVNESKKKDEASQAKEKDEVAQDKQKDEVSRDKQKGMRKEKKMK
ncbi:hypothetical protein AVEN_26788-1 [Araneus ventricosus]|uniref:Uncharacterized protein n=1 Tax=Araneus ventricosus TaxID=182803 RepID=A0A4Y2D7D7_ARAVE|nr:hypothetical protein AVEN_26788-1 [Araneus ventricosus]